VRPAAMVLRLVGNGGQRAACGGRSEGAVAPPSHGITVPVVQPLSSPSR
jgi:hypothetical protein